MTNVLGISRLAHRILIEVDHFFFPFTGLAKYEAVRMRPIVGLSSLQETLLINKTYYDYSTYMTLHPRLLIRLRGERLKKMNIRRGYQPDLVPDIVLQAPSPPPRL